MAIIFPNYLQTQKYSAKKDRRVFSAAVMQEGIVHTGHYKVSQRGAGANLSVDVAAGEAWVDGDNAADQGYYHVCNDAVVNVPIATASAANPRIDAIVLAVNDSTEIGGSDEYKLEAITGTPTAAASLANLNGAPTPGNTKLLLAYVLVAKEGTKVENAAIGAKADPRAGSTGYPAIVEPKAVAGCPPQYAHGRPLGYVPACITTRASQTAAQFAGVGLSYTTENVVNNDEMHSTSSEPEKVFCKTPGLYTVSAQAVISAGGSAGGSWLVLNKNGVNYRWFAEGNFSASWSAWGVSEGSTTMRLRYGDYVSCQYVHSEAGNRNVMGTLEAIWAGP